MPMSRIDITAQVGIMMLCYYLQSKIPASSRVRVCVCGFDPIVADLHWLPVQKVCLMSMAAVFETAKTVAGANETNDAQATTRATVYLLARC